MHVSSRLAFVIQRRIGSGIYLKHTYKYDVPSITTASPLKRHETRDTHQSSSPWRFDVHAAAEFLVQILYLSSFWFSGPVTKRSLVCAARTRVHCAV